MKLALVLVSLALTGCGKWERTITAWTGDLTQKCSPHGVEYLQSDSGLALSVDQSGKPVLCKPTGS